MYCLICLIATNIAQTDANNTSPLSKLVQVSNSIVGKSIMLQLELLMLLFVKSHTGMTAIVVQFSKHERQNEMSAQFPAGIGIAKRNQPYQGN